MSLRLLIVDDNEEFLTAARELLEREGLVVVGSASSGDAAVELAERLSPDVVLIDMVLGEENGLDVAERIASGDGGAPQVILISTYAEQDFADLVEDSPAVGFVSKSRLSGAAIAELLRGAR